MLQFQMKICYNLVLKGKGIDGSDGDGSSYQSC